MTPSPLVPSSRVLESGASFASLSQSLGANLPQVSFPTFDGSNPKMWKKSCETFFSFYAAPCDMWVKLATMHFDVPTVFWLQSMEQGHVYELGRIGSCFG